MTDKTHDGGPAFPSEQGHIPDGTWNQTYSQGMTLRDWFAGQAKEQDIVEYQDYSENEHAVWVEKYTRTQARFRFADAMLATRGQS